MGNTLIENPSGVFSNIVERVLLVTIQNETCSTERAKELEDELKSLVDTMGLNVVDSIIVKLKVIQPRFYVGKGKANEIAECVETQDIDCIVFNEELSPSQQRNWEKLTDICVIDRHEVILDIFAGRASTREAILQVGLARAEYSLPRLTRAWTHLSRQRGGMRGTRGEGETQLEVDRRLVLKKIANFKEELKRIKQNRASQRKLRTRVPIPNAAIVGYTNAGKSSLLNRLTNAEVLVEDKLFATLDPTTRKVNLDNNVKLLLTDTVGFIRHLPHDLFEAFKSTLEETVMADFLIHVMDASNSQVEEQYHTTLKVLDELGASDKPIIHVFNKTDQHIESDKQAILRRMIPDALYVSVKTSMGLEAFKQVMIDLLKKNMENVEIMLPQDRYDLVSLLHRTSYILKTTYKGNNILLNAQVTSKIKGILEDAIHKIGGTGYVK